MGFAPELYKMLTRAYSPPEGYDQRYYATAYLDEQLRTELQIAIDHRSELIMNLGSDSSMKAFEIAFRGTRHTYNYTLCRIRVSSTVTFTTQEVECALSIMYTKLSL